MKYIILTLLLTLLLSAATTAQPTYGSGFKSFMSYKAITNRNTRQWEMRQAARTDSTGLRRYNGFIKIAIGTGWGYNVGDEVEVYLSSGIMFTAVVGDIKADKHTDEANKVTTANGCAVEFLICTDTIDPLVLRMGDMSVIGFEGYVVAIEEWKGLEK